MSSFIFTDKMLMKFDFIHWLIGYNASQVTTHHFIGNLLNFKTRHYQYLAYILNLVA